MVKLEANRRCQEWSRKLGAAREEWAWTPQLAGDRKDMHLP